MLERVYVTDHVTTGSFWVLKKLKLSFNFPKM